MTEKVEIFHSKVITGFNKDGEIYQRIIPFEWQSLTDEEMTECIVSICNTDDGTGDTRDLIRAVEAKLKEKNNA